MIKYSTDLKSKYENNCFHIKKLTRTELECFDGSSRNDASAESSRGPKPERLPQLLVRLSVSKLFKPIQNNQ